MRSRSIGLDEAYLDLSGLPAPRAEMRRLALTIERRTGLGCSIGIGPEQARGQGRLRCREAARFRRADARAGVRALRGRAVRTDPGDRARRRPSGCERPGSTRWASWRRRPAEQLATRFGARLGAALQRRARFEDDEPGDAGAQGRSPSPRETTFDHDIADPSALERGAPAARRAAVRSARRASSAAGARSGSRSALTISPPTPGRGRCTEPVARRSGCCRSPGPAAALRPAAAGAAARGQGRRPGAGGSRRRATADAGGLSGWGPAGGPPGGRRPRSEADQYRALASRRRDSRASGFSTPSSSRIPTTTRRMSSRAAVG